MQLQSINFSHKINLPLVLCFSTTLGYRLSIVGKYGVLYILFCCVLSSWCIKLAVVMLVADKSTVVVLINNGPVVHAVKFELG